MCSYAAILVVNLIMFFPLADDWKSDQIRWKSDAVHLLPKRSSFLKVILYFRHRMVLQEILRNMYISCWIQSRLPLHTILETILPFLSFLITILRKGNSFCAYMSLTFNKLAKGCKTSKANVVYKKEVAEANCLSEQVPTHMPKDLKQLQSLRFKHLNESRISRDDLYNLHEIAYDITGFGHKIITYPDLACVCGLEQILKEANQILQLNETGQLLSYDTTFQLGDFYVLVLLLSLGVKVSESTTSERNLTKLCKATRSQKEKKTGRK